MLNGSYVGIKLNSSDSFMYLVSKSTSSDYAGQIKLSNKKIDDDFCKSDYQKTQETTNKILTGLGITAGVICCCFFIACFCCTFCIVFMGVWFMKKAVSAGKSSRPAYNPYPINMSMSQPPMLHPPGPYMETHRSNKS